LCLGTYFEVSFIDQTHFENSNIVVKLKQIKNATYFTSKQ
jgi:hypothetical protein